VDAEGAQSHHGRYPCGGRNKPLHRGDPRPLGANLRAHVSPTCVRRNLVAERDAFRVRASSLPSHDRRILLGGSHSRSISIVQAIGRPEGLSAPAGQA
jgi:hypothetical protein